MTSDNVSHLEQELEGLEQALRRESDADRRASIAVFCVSLAIGLVILGFVLANYLHFKKEWTSAKFQTSLTRELEELNPTAMVELEQLGKTVLPVYAEESRKQFDRLGPKMVSKLGKEFDQVASDLQKDVHVRLTTLEQRVGAATRKAIFEAYPGLRDDRAQAQLTESFLATTNTAVEQAVKDFDDRFRHDADQLSAVLGNFEAPSTGTPTVDLQKRFLSLWLKQIDLEIQKL